MSCYTERNGMRRSVKKKYKISVDDYDLLFMCCSQYYDNIAWRYPKRCHDGCCGIDQHRFDVSMKIEIPSLYRNQSGNIGVPSLHESPELSTQELDVFIPDFYNQYALLDYIEFFAKNCRDISTFNWNGNTQLIFKNTDEVFSKFQKDINYIFSKAGLLYFLNENKEIERIVEMSPLNETMEEEIQCIKEPGLQELLLEAIELHRSARPVEYRYAVEKIWDAFERLKSFYVNLKKKDSVEKIVNDIAGNQAEFVELFDDEFKTLTDIGNEFRIRHHETNKFEINDPRHYDYLFNRCLSLIIVALQYLE